MKMDDGANDSENSKTVANERQIFMGDALLSAAELADVLDVARRQRMEETARLALLKRRQLEGELVSIDLVVQFLEDLVIRVRSTIMAVPARVARKNHS
jgi:phage terminase Nu1 subunit (DNA packaging protein)